MAPKVITGWSAVGSLIPRRAISVGPAVYAPAEGGLVLQQKLEEPNMYTLQFFIQPSPDPVSHSQVINVAQADIIWTVAGGSVRRKMVVFDGNAISGTGSYVQVTLKDYSDTRSLVQRANYDAAITLARGVRANSGQPPTWFIRDPETNFPNGPPFQLDPTGGPGNSDVTIDIDTNIGANQFMVTCGPLDLIGLPSLDNDLEISQLSAGVVVLGRHSLKDTSHWLPLIGGCRAIRIRNRSTTVTWSVGLILGIEG